MPAKAEISYISTDFDMWVNALISKVPLLTDKWTDFNTDDIGMTLIDLMASTGTMMVFYANRNAQSLLFPSVRELKHAISWAHFADSKVYGPSSALTTLRFTPDTPVTAVTIIPKWTKVVNLGATKYSYRTTRVGYLYPGGESYVDIPALQGDLVKQEGATAFKSDGTTYQVFRLTKLAAENSVSVYVNGIEYFPVDTWADSGPNSRHCRIEMNYLKDSYVYFGDGVRGMIPPINADITAYYLYSDEENGNRGSGTIEYLDSPGGIVDINGKQVSVSVTNIDDATGGDGIEDVDEFKKRLPANVRAGWKAHSKTDFTTYSESYPGIKQAKVLDIRDHFSVTPSPDEIKYYEIRIYVVPDGDGEASKALLDALVLYLENKAYIPADIIAYTAEYKDVRVAIKYKLRAGFDQIAVETEILSAVNSSIKIANQPIQSEKMTGIVDGMVFGGTLYYSQVVSVIQLISGVHSVSEIRFYTSTGDYINTDVDVDVDEIIRLSAVTITRVTG